MEKVITWLSKDRLPFTDPAECAKHEIESIPGFKDLMCAALSNAAPEHQLNWCGGNPSNRNYDGPCACMGCINHVANSAGLTYYHWDFWVKNLRKAHIIDHIEQNATVFRVIMTNPGADYQKTMLVLRKHGNGMSLAKIADMLKFIREDKPATVFENVSYFFAMFMIKKLKDLTDATFEILL